MVIQSTDGLISGVAAFNTGTNAPLAFTPTSFGAVTTTGAVRYVPPFIFDQKP
jgi:hypothetical protein